MTQGYRILNMMFELYFIVLFPILLENLRQAMVELEHGDCKTFFKINTFQWYVSNKRVSERRIRSVLLIKEVNHKNEVYLVTKK